jgi:hypothetical protein
MMSSMIPVHAVHSYREQDRELNRVAWERFWNEGFEFSVDPKSGEPASIPHLELMMRRSAAVVTIAPYRADQDHYKTSPFIVFEHNMAVRAMKHRLVIAEERVAGHPFERSPLFVFQQRDDLVDNKQLTNLIRTLREQSAPLAETAGHALGSVGLVLPPGRGYQAANATITNALGSAGYRVSQIPFHRTRTPDVSELDKHDFFVIDVGAQGMMSALYHRFVPAIWLGNQSGTRRDTALPSSSEDPPLDRAVPDAQRVIWWNNEEELMTHLQPVVDKIQSPRRQFRSLEEGVRYFQSLGRALDGPVFISNAKPQNDLALHLSRALDLNNITFFHYQYKNSIPMGTVWAGQLVQRIRSSALFVALITSDYWDSALCRQEYQLAQQLMGQGRLTIFKYFMDDTVASVGIADELQGTDLSAMDTEQRLQRVVEDVDGYLTTGRNIAAHHQN